ncbi:MAG: tetratricopeptide repeat protein, partial [Moorea sp. SIO2B7]|nr:tetratricopeptide repeat protein [Moorena sp. SIO2B7]
TQTLKIEPTFADAFYKRGLARLDLNKVEEAIQDFKKAADLFQEQGRTENYQEAMEAIKKL